MALSIFNSSAYGRIAPRPWGKVFSHGLLLTAVFFALFEITSRGLGFNPTIFDNYELWSNTFTKALQSEERALIFVGASRNGADIHIPTIHEKYPVIVPAQLSTGNGSALPTLELIADYTEFHGTLIIDVMPSVMFTEIPPNRRIGPDYIWPKRYELELVSQTPPTLGGLELDLTLYLQETLISRSGVLGPLVILDAVKSTKFPSPPFYWITRDRVLMFDYSLVADLEKYRQSRATGHEQYSKLSSEALQNRIEWVNQKVTKILDRGGRVVFLRFPVKGRVLEKELSRFPDDEYWNIFIAGVGGEALNTNEVKTFTQFTMTDDDHIDSEHAAPFTELLIEHLNL